MEGSRYGGSPVPGEAAAPVLAGHSGEGGRVLTGHPAEMPWLTILRSTSGQTEHLGEPGRGLWSPSWGRHSAHLTTKAGGYPCHTRSISCLKSQLQPNRRERSQSKAKAESPFGFST